MSTFPVTTAVNMDSLAKLGLVAGLAWTRVTTTATVTQVNHGYAANDTCYVAVTSDAAAITAAVKTVASVVNANTFTFTCLNAGAASGTVSIYPVDNYQINGGYLTVDSHSRYGVNQNTRAGLGNIVMSASLGGTIEFISTDIRTIAYNTGTGNVPALDTVISQGGASGKLLGVYSALTAAPTAAGAAMPASGYIMVRRWNSVSYSAGALTGIAARATAADRAGWLEIVGFDGFTATVNRLNTFKVTGDWYDFQGATTDGNRATTYQIPTHGSSLNYFPGVWVETASASGLYEFYPCAGNLSCSITNMATDAIRGKFCWINAATGLLRFGSDGTISTGGYVPPSGCKIRLPNIFFITVSPPNPLLNVIPNATLTTRYKFSTTLAGVINIDKCSMNWQATFQQPYSVALTNTGIMTQLTVSEIASPIAWSQVGVGQEAANTQNGLSMILCVAGGTMDKCTWTRASANATSTVIMTDVTGLTITNERTCNILLRTGAATTHVLTRVQNCTWTSTTLGNGTVTLSTCSDVTFTTTTFYSDPGGALIQSTASANPLYVWSLLLSCVRIKMDGLTFGGLTLCQPYSGVLNIGLAGNSAIRLRNLGTYAAPLDMGGAQVTATWTHATTTATATKVAHGLKVGDIVYVIISSDITCITVGAKTVASVPTVDTFTFTCLNAGTTGTIEYYPTMAAVLVNIVAAHNGSDIKIQRCYTPHIRTNPIIQGDNSNKGVILESVVGDFVNAPTSISLNQQMKQLSCTHPLAAQSSVYGTHWLDQFITGAPTNLANQAWTRATTTATLTSVGHGLRTGDLISVTVTSSAAAVILEQKSITARTKDTFTFTCLNAGAASGTLTYAALTGRIAIQMNEKTAETSSVYSFDSGSNFFTSAGGCFMPVIGNQITFTAPENILGHTGFPIHTPVMGASAINNFDTTYSLDNGATYKNLYYQRQVVPLTANAVASNYISMALLSSTRALVAFIGTSSFVQLGILNIASGLIDADSIVSLNAVASSYVSITPISSTRAVVAYVGTSSFLQSAVVDITANNVLTFGAVLTVNAVGTSYVSVTKLSSTQCLVAYAGTSTFLQACTLDISGTSLTNGAVLTVNAVVTTYISVAAVSSTQAVVAYRNGTTTFVNACTLNVSGTTVTNGTVLAANAADSTYMAVAPLSSTQAILTFVGTSSFAQACTLDVSGTNLTNGAVMSINAAASTYLSVAALSSTKALVTYTESTFLKSAVLSISGTTVTAGSVLVANTAATTYKSVVGLSETRALVAYNGASTYLQARVLDISGTSVTTIADSLSAGSTITLANGIGNVAVNDYVFGTGSAPLAKVQSINGDVVTLSIANTALITGPVYFNQLPNETVAAATVGFPLRLRMKTVQTNLVAATSLYFSTTSTAASRAATYPLDTYTLTLTGLQDGSDVVVLNAGTTTELANVDSNSGSSYAYTYSTLGNVDIGVFKLGYVPYYIRNYALSTTAASIPVAQVVDRAYS